MSDNTLTIEISGTNYKLSQREKNYTEKKCRKLVNHMSARLKESAFVSVKLTKIDPKDGNEFLCEAVLTMPNKTMAASESAPNLEAAVDIVENKLQRQIRKYKTERREDGLRGGIMSYLKRSLRRR